MLNGRFYSANFVERKVLLGTAPENVWFYEATIVDRTVLSGAAW